MTSVWSTYQSILRKTISPSPSNWLFMNMYSHTYIEVSTVVHFLTSFNNSFSVFYSFPSSCSTLPSSFSSLTLPVPLLSLYLYTSVFCPPSIESPCPWSLSNFLISFGILYEIYIPGNGKLTSTIESKHVMFFLLSLRYFTQNDCF